MAIRFPTSKKKHQQISSNNEALNHLIDSMEQPATVQTTDVVHEQVGLKPVRKAPDKKQLALLGVLLLVGLGALAYFLLPNFLPQDEPTPPPVAKTHTTPVASSPRTASQTASSPMAVSTAGASTASATAINNQTIVITGDHLKNGIPASTATADMANVKPAKNTESVAPMADSDIAFAGQTNSPSVGDNQIAHSSKSSMSYAEFVKTSESTVFADDASASAPSSTTAKKTK